MNIFSDWRLRAALVVPAGIFIFWLVTAVTVESVLVRRAPDTVLRWHGNSAAANANVAARAVSQRPSREELVRVREHAQKALAREPGNVVAARTLAVAFAAAGSASQAERLMRYSHLLSRRDLVTHLWMIEQSVARNDVPDALRHYDRALRTSSAAHEILYPVLIAAAGEANIRQPLLRLLAQRPPWWRTFLFRVTGEARSPDTLHQIASALALDPSNELERGYIRDAIRRLVQLQGYAEAFDLYARARRMSSQALPLLRNGDFEREDEFAPIDWSLRDEAGLGAVRRARDSGSEGHALELVAESGRTGEVAHQVLRLPPGAHTLSLTVAGGSQDPLAQPQITIGCIQGHQLLQARIPFGPEPGRSWAARFAVPASCPFQRLSITIASGTSETVMRALIDDLIIRPTGS